ncbi:hypothetical protein ACFSQT_20505 [Mesorhizobium calcicola]|uniref:Propionyl-coenzyme A carboxylase alpha polypeptide n=1 Tax=Mesorhizobium calcicola TaxID=1300310 RepID=A0ABW4WIQ8_9HYPH
MIAEPCMRNALPGRAQFRGCLQPVGQDVHKRKKPAEPGIEPSSITRFVK